MEALIAQFWQQGREQHRMRNAGHQEPHGRGRPSTGVERSRMADDSAGDITAAQTYLLITWMHGWSLEAYQACSLDLGGSPKSLRSAHLVSRPQMKGFAKGGTPYASSPPTRGSSDHDGEVL